jgi:hypothetical protein
MREEQKDAADRGERADSGLARRDFCSHRLGALPLAFDFTSGYAAIIYVVGGLLILVAAAEKLYGWSAALKRRLRPEPPTPPIIVLGAPTYHISLETVRERKLTPLNYLTKLDPSYLIENKEATVTVTDVTTGVRRKDDGRQHTFGDFKAAALAPLQTAPVRNVSLPFDLFDGLTDQDYQAAFIFWAHFTAPGGVRWEVGYDPQTREHHRTQLPATS